MQLYTDSMTHSMLFMSHDADAHRDRDSIVSVIDSFGSRRQGRGPGAARPELRDPGDSGRLGVGRGVTQAATGIQIQPT